MMPAEDPTGAVEMSLATSSQPPVSSPSYEQPKSAMSEVKLGPTLILVGCLPFAVGGTIALAGGEGTLPDACVFRLTTGLPCPLCGGTRAFTYAAQGSPRFLSYNGFWVFVAVALIIMGLTLKFSSVSLRNFWRPGSRLPLYGLLLLLASGWVWAMANRGLIAA